MAFLDETAKLLGIDEKTRTNTFVYASQSGVVVEGYKKIQELSNAKITLIGNPTTTIIGKNLQVKEISYREMSVEGEISSVQFD